MIMSTKVYRTVSERIWFYTHRILCGLILIFLITPILAIVPLSFSESSFLVYPIQGFSLRWYESLLNSPSWMLGLKNTLIVAPIATFIAMVLGTLAALGFNHANFRGKAFLMSLLISPMVVPVVIVGVAAYSGVFDGESKVVNDDKTLVVGFDAEFPPYGYKDDNGEYVGFDLDVAQEVCDRNNWTLVKQPIDWDAKDSELNSGSIDCIWNGFTMNGREDQYTWSDPYFDNKQVIVVKNGSGIDSLSDLKGKNVETQKDSSALAALQGDQKALADTFGNLVEVADYNTAFMDLESGACDAIAVDIGVAHYQINSKDNGGDFVILNDNISSEQYAIGFKNGNTELRDQVQSTLDEMFKDGTIDKIADKYSDYDIKDSLIRK